MKLFTLTQEAIIRYLIAENEEIEEPNPLGPYLRAFSGGLLPNMRFTLCPLGASRLSLYVQEEDADEPVSLRCMALKQKLLEIADFIRYLIREGYVQTLPKHCGEYPLPEQERPGRWFRYEDFTPRERASLAFACSVQLIPRLKLYDYWEQQKKGKSHDGSQPNTKRSH
ncbi:MAG: hypothetical protein LBC51_09080 [Treponema sp.]|jgi:hypothetical protein|nr:hypothetical protein [Treponema sp.]